MSEWITPATTPVTLDGEHLTIEDLVAISGGARVELAPSARSRMVGSTAPVVRAKWAWIAGDAPEEGYTDLVRGFVLGHCAGVGDVLPAAHVRAIVAARVNVFASGRSGVRAELADRLLALLNDDRVPVVRSQGPVGAAGSAVLAEIARVVSGWGGRVWSGSDMVNAPPSEFVPTEKEALALVNGATYDTALAALALYRADRLLDTAEAACGLSFEVMKADPSCLSARALEARRHPGAIRVAARLRARCDGSELVQPRGEADSFSIRCAPAVLGAARDAVAYVRGVVEQELNGAGDNPLHFDGEQVEAGNFHGAPVALVMDHLKVALTQVASISERRIFRLTYGELSGLPSFLLPGDGINNGLMLAQYTAASLVSECKGLAHPASVDSIPTVQHHEDHVSMGSVAARTALHVADLLADVLAIELLCAAQGLEFRLDGEKSDAAGRVEATAPLRPGAGNRATFDEVRRHVPRWVDDRVMHPDLAALGAAVRSGVFI